MLAYVFFFDVIKQPLCRVLGVLVLASTIGACTSNPSKIPAISGKIAELPTVSLDSASYKLASGDTVRVDVLGEPDLSLQVLIDPAGRINYPFLGHLSAAGMTVGQLQQKIFTGLNAGYLVKPDVRVSIAQYRSIYVSGQVRQPGAYSYSVGLTVDKVLTLAGGMTQFASPSRIYLQRSGVATEKRANVTLDSPVYPGDTIVVEERLF